MGTKGVVGAVATTAVLVLGWNMLRPEGVQPLPTPALASNDAPEVLVQPASSPDDEGNREGVERLPEIADPVVETEPESIAIAPELLIRGRVVDADGNAVAGASVALRRDPLKAFTVLDLERERTPRPVSDLRTDDDGTFRFEVARGKLRSKGVDLVVANRAVDAFDRDDNVVVLVSAEPGVCTTPM